MNIDITINPLSGSNGGFLVVDFDLVAVHPLAQGENSFTHDELPIFPAWFLDIQNEAGVSGTTVNLNSIIFQNSNELSGLVPTPDNTDTTAGFEYTWNSITLNDQENSRVYFGEQSSVSENFNFAFDISYTAELNGNNTTIPIPLTDGDLVKVTVELTPTDAEWDDLDVLLAFPGFVEENFNPLLELPSVVDSFASVSLIDDSGPMGITPEIDVDAEPPLVSFEWEILNSPAANQTMTFVGEVKYSFLQEVESATLEPFLVVGGSRSSHEATENWSGSSLTLPTPLYNGSVTLTGATPDETDTSLYSLGVQFFDRTTKGVASSAFDISGSITKARSQSGNIVIEAFPNDTFTTPSKKTEITEEGPFIVEDLIAGSYYIRAYVDENPNNMLESDSEIVGIYRQENGSPKRVTIGPDARNINITLIDDLDIDGLPNDWETSNGLNPDNSVGDQGTLGDKDGDQLTNYEEFINDSDPQLPTIAFQEGWNLISWPKNFDTGTTTLESQLMNVPWQGSVWTLDEANEVLFQVNESNDGVDREKAMIPTNGYWVFATALHFLDVDRDVPTGTMKSLADGWNLVGGVHGGALPNNSEINIFWERTGKVYAKPRTTGATKGFWVNVSSSTTVDDWR